VFWLQWQQFFHQLPALDALLIGCAGLRAAAPVTRTG
jgi:hypothetical protein